jgi:glyoxylase-like metal-dependent hydrolase (beta-lactamase superfamily II)
MSLRYSQALSRRGFCICCVAAASGNWPDPAEAAADPRDIVDLIRDYAAKTPIRLHKLRGNVTIIEGSGGNIAVLTGGDGKLFVDAGITATRPRILEAINNLSRDPIRHLINTHWHFDHTDGNEWLNEQGAAILAHENTHKHLQSAIKVEDWEYSFPARSLAAVPSEVFASEKTLNLNRSTLHLKYYGPAHTDSDISVTFAEADILHCGDTFWNGFYPFIDYSSGGSIDGMIRAAETNIAAVSNKTIVIPGHNMPDRASPTSNKTELVSFRDMLVATRENVAKLKQQGRSLDETTAAGPTASFDAKWGQFLISPAFFTKMLYEGV